MKLAEYMKENGITLKEMGKRCLCAASTIGDVARYNRCSENIAIQIVHATGGKVTLKDMEVLPNNNGKGNNWNRRN